MASNDAAAPWISLRDITVTRRGHRLLRCGEFDIRPGELHVLTGKQGGGKTVLCNVLCGDEEPGTGTVVLDGETRRRYNPDIAHRLGVERVTAVPRVFAHLSVSENISIGLSRHPNRYWFGRRALAGRVAEWLAANGIGRLSLDSLLDRVPEPEHLFVQVLSSLFNRPRLIILDETLENLPVNRRDQVMGILRREMAKGMSVLWATHQLEDGWRLADRLTILRHGQILLTDLPGNIDRRSLLRLAFAQFPETEEDDRDRERFHNLILYTEALLKDLPLAIVIVDNQGLIQFSNRAGRAMLPELAAEPPEGLSLPALLGDRNAAIRRAIADVMDAGDGQAMHAIPFLSGHGEKRVDCQVQAVRDGLVTIGAMLIMNDVSEREKLRNRLILSHNVSSVGLLAAGVAHDVNNPLAAIGNYLSYLMRNVPEGNLRDTAERIAGEAEQIQKIIDNLVAFSGHVRKDLNSVDLYALAGDLCALLRFTAESSGITLTLVPPGAGAATDLLADVKEMRQLLLNLIRNAMEAMPRGGGVDVDFSGCSERGIVIEVADNGPGIEFERPEDVFEPFVSSKSDDDRYHGIGLTIVYSIVEKYGGAIGVANREEGGCVFTLRFPAVEGGGRS